MTCPACDLPCPVGVEACPRCGLELSNGIGRRTHVGARYEVLGLLGRGSVATVYRALDRLQDEVVAVKVFRPDIRRTSQTDAAFRTDIGLAQAIRHRNVCGVRDSGEHAGLLFMVLECLNGTTLKQRLKGRAGLAVDEAFDLGGQMAAGLQAVHEAGLLHQDLKPQNVLVDERGVARLMDMDVTKRWGASGPITITSVGQLFGAPEYVSPEHARGVETDERSDVYGLGCILYEMLTGHPPFRAATPVATALKHVHEPIPLEGPKASRIPEALLPVLRKALAKNPSRRYASAKALASALSLARTMSGAPARLAIPRAEKPLPLLLSALNPTEATLRLNLEDVRPKDPTARRAIPLLLGALEKARAQPPREESLLDLLVGVEETPAPEASPAHGDDVPPPAPGMTFLGNPGSLGILIDALKEKDGQVRSKAARALGGIGPGAKEAIPVLLDALHDREAHVRWDAARALGQIGAAAAEGLAAAVNDKDPVVRQIAVDALKLIIQRKRSVHSAD